MPLRLVPFVEISVDEQLSEGEKPNTPQHPYLLTSGAGCGRIPFHEGRVEQRSDE